MCSMATLWCCCCCCCGALKAVTSSAPCFVPRVQAGTEDAAEVAALLAEEHVELVADGDRDKLREVDSLTGQPRGDDILLFALPVRVLFPLPLCVVRTREKLSRWHSMTLSSGYGYGT